MKFSFKSGLTSMKYKRHFSESHDDTIRNGLSLLPNFHRAFDWFLITIDKDYRVVVSRHFTETGGHSLRAFEGEADLFAGGGGVPAIGGEFGLAL